MSAAELEIENLSIGYRSGSRLLRVLDGVDLRIAPGEVVGLVGESGSGKSTLAYSVVRHLGRSAHILGGSIRLAGEELLAADEARMRQIRGSLVSMIYQDPAASLNPTIRLGEQLLESIRQRGAIADAAAIRAAHELLEMVNLPDPAAIMRRFPHEVSGGEKQCVLIAMAFASRPRLMICDEPTTALDATTAAQIMDLLRRLKEEARVSVLFISHDLGTVSQIAQRVAVIYGGRIVETGPVDEILREPAHPYSQMLLTSAVNTGRQPVRRRVIASPVTLSAAERRGEGCIYQAQCAFVGEACRRGVVRLERHGDRAIACIGLDRVAAPRLPARAAPVQQPRRLDGPALLRVEGLTVRYGRAGMLDRLLGRPSRVFNAVSEIDLTVRAGETVGLVGESGCGKSTLARTIAGLVPFTGEIALDGRSYSAVHEFDAVYRRDVQIIFQHPDAALNPKRTIGETLARPVRVRDGLRGAALRDRVRELLAMVRLPPDYASRYSHELSGGEKQRVCIARAFAPRPRLVVCDEITSGLDVSVQGTILNLLADLQDEMGIAYLFISHDLNVVRHIADRIVVMYLGRVLEERGTETDAPPYHPYTEALLSAVPILDAGVETRRIRLEGALPSPRNPPPGCSLSSRCPRRYGDICLAERPRLQKAGAGHAIACHIPAPELAEVPPLWSVAGTD